MRLPSPSAAAAANLSLQQQRQRDLCQPEQPHQPPQQQPPSQPHQPRQQHKRKQQQGALSLQAAGLPWLGAQLDVGGYTKRGWISGGGKEQNQDR
jgi:hypothetical protein